jgi:hypothetical protein
MQGPSARPPWVRPARTVLRTSHLLGFAALYGGHLYAVDAARLQPALWATVASGTALVALELIRHRIWLVQLRGWATFAKIALLAGTAVWWEQRVEILTLAVVVGGISSHMPGRFRYYSILHRRVVGEAESG